MSHGFLTLICEFGGMGLRGKKRLFVDEKVSSLEVERTITSLQHGERIYRKCDGVETTMSSIHKRQISIHCVCGECVDDKSTDTEACT